MKPIVRYHHYATELNTSPVYPETTLTLRTIYNRVMIYQNDQIINIVDAPTMRVVRGIRSMFNNAKIQLI